MFLLTKTKRPKKVHCNIIYSRTRPLPWYDLPPHYIKKEVSNIFDLAWGLTTHKAQGSTYSEMVADNDETIKLEMCSSRTNLHYAK